VRVSFAGQQLSHHLAGLPYFGVGSLERYKERNFAYKPNKTITMSSVNTVASGYRGSKRAACDRCREQKSRCPREGQDRTSDSAKCARCAKAGTVCNFSTSLRAGRPSASNSKTLSKRRQGSDSNEAAPGGVLAEEPREHHFDATNQDDGFESFLSPDGSEIWMRGAFDEATGPSSRRTTLAGDASHVSTSSEPFFTPEVASMFGGEHLDFLKQPDFSNTPLRGAEEDLNPMDLEPFVRIDNWGLSHSVYPSTNGVSQCQNTSLGQSPTATMLTPPEIQMGEAFCVPTGGTRINSGESLAGTKRATHLQARSGDKSQWETSSGFHSMTPESSSSRTLDGNWESPPTNLSPSHDIQHRRMHELSDLGMSFYSQVKETASRDEANPLALSLPDNLAVKILESSVKFLNLLTSLYPSRLPSASVDDTNPSSSSDEDMPNSSKRRPLRNHPRKQSSSNYTSNSSDDSSPQPVDMTEVFALLTCYIRILHLHCLLYSRISDFLTTLFQQGAHLPPVFPGVQAGSVSLDTFAKFQVKLLIQISTHVLGEIEMALGLPDGYRISKRDIQRQGIFEGSVSVQFIEMTMKEKGKSGLGIEKDKFTSIRDHLGRLRQLLKGTINP